MKPVIVPHSDYRSFLKHTLDFFDLCWRAQPTILRDTYLMFRELDLSAVDRILQDKYSPLGARPRQPSSMFRSLLLMIFTKILSIPLWVQFLHTSPFYAILSGFDPDDLPGVGTSYNFLKRLWDLDTPNFSQHVKPVYHKKIKKPKTKGQKAEPLEKESVEELIARLSVTAFSLKNQGYGTLFRIFKECFFDVSVRKKLINPAFLNISGDGTPVVTAARFRAHHTCDCYKSGIFNCECDRYYPQPDCDISWDSSREMFYFGYDLYMLTDADSGLPIFPLLSPASKHDSHCFCECFFRFRSFMPGTNIASLILDSAHDSMAMYRFCKDECITP